LGGRVATDACDLVVTMAQFSILARLQDVEIAEPMRTWIPQDALEARQEEALAGLVARGWLRFGEPSALLAETYPMIPDFVAEVVACLGHPTWTATLQSVSTEGGRVDVHVGGVAGTAVAASPTVLGTITVAYRPHAEPGLAPYLGAVIGAYDAVIPVEDASGVLVAEIEHDVAWPERRAWSLAVADGDVSRVASWLRVGDRFFAVDPQEGVRAIRQVGGAAIEAEIRATIGDAVRQSANG